MKKIRLLLAIVLFMIVFGFTACSHSASGSTSTPETTGNSSDTSENNVDTETDFL